jgi:hypothetical protein
VNVVRNVFDLHTAHGAIMAPEAPNCNRRARSAAHRPVRADENARSGRRGRAQLERAGSTVVGQHSLRRRAGSARASAGTRRRDTGFVGRHARTAAVECVTPKTAGPRLEAVLRNRLDLGC